MRPLVLVECDDPQGQASRRKLAADKEQDVLFSCGADDGEVVWDSDARLDDRYLGLAEAHFLQAIGRSGDIEKPDASGVVFLGGFTKQGRFLPGDGDSHGLGLKVVGVDPPHQAGGRVLSVWPYRETLADVFLKEVGAGKAEEQP